MVHHVSRTLSVVALLIFVVGVQANPPVGDPLPPQECDGGSTSYTVGAGTATGVGNSAGRATTDGASNAAHAVMLSVNPCDVCDDGRECTQNNPYDWEGYDNSIPVWDPLLNVFTVSVKWDGCTVTQTCKVCD